MDGFWYNYIFKLTIGMTIRDKSRSVTA